jgi:hypothetical protein
VGFGAIHYSSPSVIAAAGFPRAGIIAACRRPTVTPTFAFRRLIACALTLIALAGCELLKRNEDALVIINARVIGMPAGEFFDRYGRAESRLEIPDGTIAYNWTSPVAYAQAGPEGLDEHICKLRLSADRAGRVREVLVLYDAPGKKSTSRCGEIFAAK